MTNLFAVVVVTLSTNVTNIQVHENCPICDTDPAHIETFPSQLSFPPPAPLPPRPRDVRRETIEVVETAVVKFEWPQGTPRSVPFHGRVVSTVVKRYKAKVVEEEVK